MSFLGNKLLISEAQCLNSESVCQHFLMRIVGSSTFMEKKSFLLPITTI